MKRVKLSTGLVFLTLSLLSTSRIAAYPLSVATTDDALAILSNPALLSTNRGPNSYLFYNRRMKNLSLAGQWGVLGFYYQAKPQVYYLGSGLKVRDLSFGIRYRHIEKGSWNLGLAYRFKNFASLGLVLTGFKKENPITYGIALKPLKKINFYYEGVRQSSNFSHLFGLNTSPLPGTEIKLSVDTERNFTFGVSLSLLRLGFGSFFPRSPDSREGLNPELLHFSYHSDLKPSILTPRRYLELELTGRIEDLPSKFSLFGPRRRRTFYELLDLIEKAEKEPTVRALLVKIAPDFSLSKAKYEELKSALRRFQKKGKQVFVYTPNLNIENFYLASTADKIILHPVGTIDISGVYLRTTFLGDLLKKLGIAVDYERVGKYKSAPEVLTEEKLTEENREQLEALLDDIYHNLLPAFEERGIRKEKAESLINQGIFLPREGREERIFDIVAYEDLLDSIVREASKIRGKITERELKKLRYYSDYWGEKDKIAIVYINGPIAYGESKSDFLTGHYITGCQTVCRYLRRARDDPKVKAIILRIDSPGGDGLASDIIWREVEVTKKKKPVYVSMSSFAASGGYYCAGGANEIFALNSTITGSIGVFGMKFISKGLEEKIGINRETLKRGEKADWLSSERHFTEEERRLFRKTIEEFYDQFIAKVAAGRKMEKARVDSLSQGRVWSGKRAKEFGLVDKIGGIKELIRYIEDKHKLKDYEVIHYPSLKPRGLFPF